MCVEMRREYPAELVDPERAARFASAALLKLLPPSDWQISADVELVVARYVAAMRDRDLTGTAFVQLWVHSNHIAVVIGSSDPDWVDERVRLRPRRRFSASIECHLPSPRYRRAARPALWPALGLPRVEPTAEQWRETWDALHEITQTIHPDSGDPTATLDAIAAGVVRATCFHTAAVNLVEGDGNVRVVAVCGPPELAETLMGVTEPAESWQALIDGGSVWGSLRFVPYDDPLAATPEMVNWVESAQVPVDPDAWHPMNALFAPLYAQDGTWLGVLSVDPAPGARSPGVADLERLEVFADHAAAAIERIRTLAGNDRRELAVGCDGGK